MGGFANFAVSFSIICILAGGITDDTKPTLQGSLSAALSAGETLVVYHNGAKAGVAAVSGTNWSFTEGSNLVAAAWSFTARVESSAGMTGVYSAAYNITIDLGPNYIYGTAGNDSRAGTAGRDVMSGLPSTGTYLGKGSIDKLTGGGGNDIFVLGDSRGVFYDDGLSNNAGTSDYVQVMDFKTGDKIQLSDMASGYFSAQVSLGGRSGLGIYVDSNANQRFDGTDELIGQLVGVSNLKAADVIWV
jgi:Ca2+-binding RTX toxin-like protein